MRNDLAMFIAGCLWIGLGIWLVVAHPPRTGVNATEGIATAIAMGALVTLLSLCRGVKGSALRVYVAVFSLFHLSLPILRWLEVPLPYLRVRQFWSWFSPEAYGEAVALTSIALCGLVGGGLVAWATTRRRVKVSLVLTHGSISWQTLSLGLVGGGFLVWLSVLMAGVGLAGLGMNYSDFRAASNPFLEGLANVMLGFGIIAATYAEDSLPRRAAFAIYGLWAVMALALGLRGEVLWPLAAAYVVARPKMPRGRVLLGLIVVVAVIAPSLSAVAVFRNDRSSITMKEFVAEASIVGLVAELGGTLRVPVEAARGEEYVEVGAGGIYLYALQYFIANVVRVVDEPDHSIARQINALALTPSGIGSSTLSGIGSSFVAETYLSGGVVVTWLSYLMLGAFLGACDIRGRSKILVALVLFPLLVAVRNDFGFVPFHILLAHIVWLTPRLRLRRMSRCPG